MICLIQARPRPVPRRIVGACILAALASVPAMASPQNQDVAGALRRLEADTLINREVTLQDLGFEGPVVLGSRDARRELYLPVPADLPLREATLHFDASYLRGDGGRTTLLLSLDGYPVSARAFTQNQGDASLSLGVDGGPRPNGFVRFGAAWSSVVTDDRCAEERFIGNVLQIAPDTRLTYAFDTSGIADLATAWTALPRAPTMLVPPGVLSADAYDTAWRLGVALARAGKRPVVNALAAVGNEVDLAGMTVPAELRGIPAFGALAAGGRHRLSGPAELGALLAIQAVSQRADILVADSTLLAALRDALDALAQEVRAAGPDAAAAFSDWRAKAFGVLDAPLDIDEVRLATVSGRPAIVVAVGAGSKAAGLFDASWRHALLTRSVVAPIVERQAPDASVVTLGSLGGVPGSLDVLARGDWTATFDLGAVSFDGRVPSEIVVDVSAAPGASWSRPVATVFLNDQLLGARRLEADGQPERIQARVPAYALAPRNVLRVSFQRQPLTDQCREIPQAFSVAVLPTSHIRLAKAKLSEDFTGMAARLANKGSLMVPSSYLKDATQSLPSVIRIAEASGLSPTRARLMVAPDSGVEAKPEGAFLAFDLELAEAKPRASVEGNRLILRGQGDKPFFDVTGLNRVGLAQVLRAGSETGVLWQTIGAEAPSFDKPFRLARGDIALVGAEGPLVEIDSADPSGSLMAVAEDGPTRDLAWRRSLSWGVPTMIGLAALFLLLLARAAWVRRQRDQAGN